MEKKPRALTGIQATGMPHIGNYVGAIKPGLELTDQYDTFYFIADYHALNKVKDPKELREMSREVAAAWLACGLDPERVVFYKQSEVPQTFELTTILSCFTPKGLMNRAHAYKAITAQNEEQGKDIDDGVNMGLFTYPILMAADILLFDPDVIPVGRDQFQHVEMTADIAQSINHNYGKEVFRIPKPLYREDSQVVTGLDGRKMSKSYNNTIQLFLSSKQLRKHVMRVVTDSRTVEEPKDPDSCNVFSLYRLFAGPEDISSLRERYLAGGMGYGEAKQLLFEKMDAELTPHRERYNALMADPKTIDNILTEGCERARMLAERKMQKLRRTVGVR